MIRFTACFPHRGLALALMRRGAILWLLTRGMLVVLLLAASGQLIMPSGDAAAAMLVIPVAGALGVLESRRVNEHRFFAHLGVSPLVVALLGALPALGGEILLLLLPLP